MLKLRRGRDEGSTLVSVVVIMLVLSLFALTLAAVVTQTASTVVSTRTKAQSRASADAGMAAAVAAFLRSSGCPATNPSSASTPRYTTTCTSASGTQAVFTSTGTDAAGRNPVKIQAAYTVSPAADLGGDGDMVFFGTTSFSNAVFAYPLDASLVNIVIPVGDFSCNGYVQGNVVVAGNFTTAGSCNIQGGVVAGGTADVSNGSDKIAKGLTTAGTGNSRMAGSVGGSYTAAGDVQLGWVGQHVKGSMQASGNVGLGNMTVEGTLTLPSSKTLTFNSGSVLGGVIRVPSVVAPTAPTFSKWFDYAYKDSDWTSLGFHVVKLVNSGSGPGTCSYYNASPSTGWFELAHLTGKTVIDARACSNLSSNAGAQPTVAIGTDIVFVAKSFDLTRLTLNATGGRHKLWWIVEDTVANQTPTCSGGAGNININYTFLPQDLTAMAYTPCTIDIHAEGSWTGAFYSGKFDFGNGLIFHGSPILLPGQPPGNGQSGGAGGGGLILGNLVSQRDVP